MYFHTQTFQAPDPGPRLIVLGAVHGNETCGTQAILRVLNEIAAGSISILRGSVTFVPITNPLAYQHHRRSGDRNLNRNLFPNATPVEFEDHIANWLCPLLAQHEVLLDLHSFHTDGEPFALIGPLNNTGPLEPFSHAEKEEGLARHLGVERFVDGWLDTYARGVARRQAANPQATPASESDLRYGVGTTEYMRTVGGYGLTLECGQHDDPAAPEVAYRAIRNTLAYLEISGETPPPAVTGAESLRIYEVVDRASDQDTFVKVWRSFDAVQAGELIGTRGNGEDVYAEEGGYILFPNPDAASGQEWFYLAKAVKRI
jgi:predicted deacylase